MRHDDPHAASAMRRKSTTYILLTVVFVMISGLSIWMVSSLFGDGRILPSLSFLTPGNAAVIAAFLLVYFAFDSLRFYFALRALNIQISFLYIVKLTFINVFVSAITPLATGGGFAQVYFLTRRKVPLGSAMAASTIRTLLGVLFFMIAAPLVLILNPALLELLGSVFTWILMVTIFIYIVIGVLLFRLVMNENFVKAPVYRFTRFLHKKRLLSARRMRKICLGTFSEVRNFNKGVHLFLRGPKKYVALSVFFTLLFLLALFSIPLLLTWAMGYRISPAFVYQAMTVITFATYFAFTPGASGIAEGGFALMFTGSVAEGDIASLTLLWRSLSVYVGTVIGLVLFYIEVFAKPKKKGKQVSSNEMEVS
ncbi:MAG: flippase-like domain-containing protein [Oscillospiraceae bacterium]|jgi:uncharacterized protein (TIRG00374 family)|nr:flippase-like domain-containing protein [Oscillospiraceae bacterium]